MSTKTTSELKRDIEIGHQKILNSKSIDEALAVFGETRQMENELMARLRAPMRVDIIQLDGTVEPFTDTRGKGK